MMLFYHLSEISCIPIETHHNNEITCVCVHQNSLLRQKRNKVSKHVPQLDTKKEK